MLPVRCDVKKNALAGPIPTEIGQLIQLTSLDLCGNQLTGSCLQTHLIAIGKRVYHSPMLMHRKYSHGAGTIDGNAFTAAAQQPVIWYDPRLTIFDEMVNESTTHRF